MRAFLWSTLVVILLGLDVLGCLMLIESRALTRFFVMMTFGAALTWIAIQLDREIRWRRADGGRRLPIRQWPFWRLS